MFARVSMWVLQQLLDSLVYRVGRLHRWSHERLPLPLAFRWSVDDDGTHFVVDRDGEKLFVSSPDRFALYKRGIRSRVRALAAEYGIEQFSANKGLTVVDVGANIGELGLYFGSTKGARYIAFEPDPAAFIALTKNVKGQILHDVALADKPGRQKFFLATSRADSGLHRPDRVEGEVEVEVSTLDHALEGLDLPRIDILKVEAEGAEPEVLMGATRTLRKVDLCVVDAGPEREGSSTAAQCLKILQAEGFEMIDLRFPRGIMVCRRVAVADTP